MLQNDMYVFPTTLVCYIHINVLRRYPFPEIPKGWKPDPRRVWNADKDKENLTAPRQDRDVKQPLSRAEWKESQLSADQVGFMDYCSLSYMLNFSSVVRC